MTGDGCKASIEERRGRRDDKTISEVKVDDVFLGGVASQTLEGEIRILQPVTSRTDSPVRFVARASLLFGVAVTNNHVVSLGGQLTGEKDGDFVPRARRAGSVEPFRRM
eukprot:scaffold655507_cov42-Prasinocladus_malaysianus.AAC.2